MSNKEYWAIIMGIVGFIFGSYAITKSLVTEGTVPIIAMLYNSATISAIIYAGIFDIIIVAGFVLFRKTIFKNL